MTGKGEGMVLSPLSKTAHKRIMGILWCPVQPNEIYERLHQWKREFYPTFDF